ncbi:MAG TPA: reverse transcriptase family protein [Gemmataceae bacterium]|nr:reverse transcriptase family protein [Gemmataceae bacterium]
MPTNRTPLAIVNFANALLAGPWTYRSMVARGNKALPGHVAWMRKSVRHILNQLGSETAPLFHELLALLTCDARVSHAIASIQIGKYYWLPNTMSPRGVAAQSWSVPPLTSLGQLADWLGISHAHLDWFADIHGWTAQHPSLQLRHYACLWKSRRQGRCRLLESPKAKLKALQRKILHGILDHIPPHPAAHGFRPGRSIVTYAQPHVSQKIVLRFDLRDFFSTVRPSRIHAIFRTAGYPQNVARLLTGLCTSHVPLDVWEHRPDPRDTDAKLWEKLRGPHLPQGAPTSPALANLCAYRLDLRLHGLAQSLQAVYTRYADDLAFSGGDQLARSSRRVQIAVAVIAAEEGFDLHFQKSRFMRQAVCQQLAGVVVNERPNIRRDVFDALKAILTNCVRHGPDKQNRDNHPDFRRHLLGRIAHVKMIHPQRGAKLQSIFDRIKWDS